MRRVMHEALAGIRPCLIETSFATPAFLVSLVSRQLPSISTSTTGCFERPLILEMSEKLVPLSGEEAKIAPPPYEAAAIEHGALPARNGPPTPGSKPMPRGPFPLDIPVLNQLRGKRVILASASPRRKQILFSVHFPHSVSFRPIFLTLPDWPSKS